jgi:hypothetical protein
MLSGMGFVIPTIPLRPLNDLSLLRSAREAPFGDSFDQELLISRLSVACPQIPIYTDVESAATAAIEIFKFPAQPGQTLVPCKGLSPLPSDFC